MGREGDEGIVPCYPCLVSTARTSQWRWAWVWTTLLPVLGHLFPRLSHGREAAVQDGWAPPSWSASEVLVGRQRSLVRGGRQKMIGTALGNLNSSPSTPPFHFASPRSPKSPLSPWRLCSIGSFAATVTEMESCQHEWNGQNQLICSIFSWWQISMLHIYDRVDLSLVWQGYMASINVTQMKDSRSHFEWALLIPYFTQLTYPYFKPLLITLLNTLEYNSYRVYRFFCKCLSALITITKFPCYLILVIIKYTSVLI